MWGRIGGELKACYEVEKELGVAELTHDCGVSKQKRLASVLAHQPRMNLQLFRR
jgi:hypothetical protein